MIPDQESFAFGQPEKHGLARRSDPVTSHWAAEQVDVNRAERLVVEAIRRAGPRGLIADQFPALTGLRLNTATARTRPLCQKGLIYDSGMKRLASSGRLQIVWRAR